MSLKTRKRIKTPTGLFFTSFETRRRVRPQRVFFSRVLKREGELDPGGSFFQVRVDRFFTSWIGLVGNFISLWYNE